MSTITKNIGNMISSFGTSKITFYVFISFYTLTVNSIVHPEVIPQCTGTDDFELF